MTPITISQILKHLQSGQAVQINNWDTVMTVAGISDRYVLVYDPALRDNTSHEYSVLCKLPDADGIFWCAPDDWIFGYAEGYHFNDTNWVKKYLDDFENGENRMSHRNRAPIVFIEVHNE